MSKTIYNENINYKIWGWIHGKCKLPWHTPRPYLHYHILVYIGTRFFNIPIAGSFSPLLYQCVDAMVKLYTLSDSKTDKYTIFLLFVFYEPNQQK